MNSIKLFESKHVRSVWNEAEEKWYFSIHDIVFVLTDSSDVKQYVKRILSRDPSLKLKWGTICTLVEMKAADGKLRKIQAADTAHILRLIQSIPSPKAEPFKQWLAQTGYERIEESQDPEKSIDRAMENYMQLGYSKEWINQRLKSIEVRKELTDEWESRGVKKGQEFAVLTDVITQAWSGKTVKQYKQHKNLKKENLRDNMTNLELVLNMLAEATTAEISKEKKPANFTANKAVAKQGGVIAGNTRKAIEAKTGKKVVSSQNAKKLLTKKPKKK